MIIYYTQIKEHISIFMVWTLRLLAFKGSSLHRNILLKTQCHKMANYIVSTYQSIWLNIITAQWLMYQSCKQQITSLSLPKAFVYTYWIKLKILIQLFIQNCIFFPLTNLSCILLIHRNIFYNQVNFFNLRNYLYFKI